MEENGEDERKKEKRKKMKRKWLSMDGLSSEVRLNRAEVNNGCLVKGRGSQSGSNNKRKKEVKKTKKTAASLSEGKLPDSICLSVQHTLSPAITTHQLP